MLFDTAGSNRGNRLDPVVISMRKLFAFIGATIGGYAGWYVGALVGFMLAFMLSMVGTGIGMYIGIRAARNYE